MKRITINGKEYTVEYTIEASLYDDCTLSMMDMFVKGGMAQGAAEDRDIEGAMRNLMETIANLPQKVLTLFYAGLLEHHGPEGDKSVQSRSDAKKILAKYLNENKKSFRDVLEELTEVMAEDNFFDLIGLNQMTAELAKDESSEVGKSTSIKK